MPPEIEDRGRLEGMTGGLCCPCPSCVYKSCHGKKTSVEQWGVWGAQAALSRPEGAVGRPRVPLGEGLVWLKLPAGATRGRSWLLASLLGGGVAEVRGSWGQAAVALPRLLVRTHPARALWPPVSEDSGKGTPPCPLRYVTSSL